MDQNAEMVCLGLPIAGDTFRDFHSVHRSLLKKSSRMSGASCKKSTSLKADAYNISHLVTVNRFAASDDTYKGPALTDTPAAIKIDLREYPELNLLHSNHDLTLASLAFLALYIG